jgi:hypothetical protein
VWKQNVIEHKKLKRVEFTSLAGLNVDHGSETVI